MAKVRVNGEIRGTRNVRVVGPDGGMIGVLPLAEALRLASKQGLDLVEVNPAAHPPVCKLLNFSKYRARSDDDTDTEDPEGA